MLGRGFQPEEGEAGGKPVVLISRRLWQSRFASDPAILGRAITLGQDAYTIIGVMPAEFPFPFTGTGRLGDTPDEISPACWRNRFATAAGYLMAIARLKPGVPPNQAEAEVRLLGSRIPAGSPGQSGRRPARASRIAAAPGDTGCGYSADAADSHGRGRFRAADRLRQCGRPDAGASRRARQGDGDPQQPWERAAVP